VQQFKPSARSIDDTTLPIVGLATRTPVDHVLLEMLCLAVNSTEARFQPIGTDLDGNGAVARALSLHPDLVCVVSLSPTRGSEVRGYCRQLRSEHPNAKLLVLRPNVADTDASRSAARIKEAGADCVASSIAEALEAIERLCPTCPSMDDAEPVVIDGSVSSDKAAGEIGDSDLAPAR